MDTRILVEHPDTATRDAMAAALRRAGYTVLECGGPRSLPGGRCRYVTEGDCDLVRAADAVVCGLNLDAPATVEVLRLHRAHAIGIPVIVEATRPRADQHADLLAGTTRLPFPCSRDSLVQAVGDALAQP